MKPTIQQIKQQVTCEVISTEYVDGSTPMLWRCSCGSEFTKTWTRMRESKHHTCLPCARRASGKAKAFTHQQVKDYLKQHEVELLSQYTGRYTDPLKMRCKCTTTFVRSFQTFKNGSRLCPTCAGKTPWTTQSVADLISQLGGKLVSEYKDSRSLIQFECSCCSSLTTRRFGDVRNSNHARCQSCSYRDSTTIGGKLDYKFVSNHIQTTGCELLSEYKGIADLLTIRCGCGEIFEQQFSVFRSRKFNGCKICTLLYHHPNYTRESAQVLQSPSQLAELHQIQKLSLSKIADELNVSNQTVSNAFALFNIPVQFYNAPSAAEVTLVNQLSQFISTINVSDRTIIKPQELDIVLPDHNIAIEFNGLYWHSERRLSDNRYHAKKHTMCKNAGYQLISIFEDEWNNKPDVVLDLVLSKCGLSSKPVVYGRNTSVFELHSAQYSEFVVANHIQGAGRASIRLGLIHNQRLVAVMGFTKSTNNHYYLDRYCSSGTVVGGFSKLLKRFITQYKPSKIVSFADLRVSTGAVYLSNGFVIEATLPADYGYVKHTTRYHKSNFRRKLLLDKFDNFDPAKTERENCNNNGYWQIWDCGKLKLVLDL